MPRKIPAYQQIEKQEVEDQQKVKEYRHKQSLAIKANKLSPAEILDEIVKGTPLPTTVKNRDAWEEVKNVKWNPSVLTFLKNIFAKSDTFINSIGNIRALPNIVKHYAQHGKMQIEDWKPKRRHHTHQLKELIDHLFLKYEVPDFLYKSFWGNPDGIELFFHITNGKPFKDFTKVPPLKLNKKVYPHLFTTPEDYSYFQGFRRAQILSMGGDERLVNAFMRSQLGDSFLAAQDEFWVTVIQLFVGTNMFNLDKIPEIVDYIHAQKYQTKLIRGENRIPSPNFSMKGRTPQTLLDRSDDWHKEEAHYAKMARRAMGIPNGGGRYARYKPTPPPNVSWDPKPIGNYSQSFTRKDMNTGMKYTLTYYIKQLTCTTELLEESAEMKNCVYSYVTSCKEGRSTIFSTREENKKTGSKIMTIEVRGQDIVQVRTINNRRINKDSVLSDLLKNWATKEKLNISNYAL